MHICQTTAKCRSDLLQWFFLLSLFNMETVLCVKERNPEKLVPSCAILQIPSALVNVFLRIVCLQESLSRAATRPGR